MVSWVLIGFLVLIVAILFIKFEHHAKRIKLILLLLFIAFIYFSASSVIKNNDVKLNSVSGWIDAGGLYFSWLGNIGTNLWNAGGQMTGLVGNVIKTNSTEVGKDWEINIKK